MVTELIARKWIVPFSRHLLDELQGYYWWKAVWCCQELSDHLCEDNGFRWVGVWISFNQLNSVKTYVP